MGKDYYAILGVPRSAETGDAEIKKAYRKMALKWHPDRNPNQKDLAEAKFKDVAEAYDVLSDPEKRAVYDQFGEEGLKGGMPGGAGPSSGGPGGFPGGGFSSSRTYHFDPSQADDIFSQFFGPGFSFSQAQSGPSGGGMGGMGGMGGQDPFGGMFGGGMDGMGGMPRRSRGTGGGAGGMSMKGRPVTFELGVTLEELFTGCTKKMKITRHVRGAEVEKVIEIAVKPGWKDGTKITFPGAGDEPAGMQASDVVFVIRQKPHALFTRHGDDLHYTCHLSLRDALTNPVVEIPGLDGKRRRITLSRVVSPQSRERLPDMGMPSQRDAGKRGSLVLNFYVAFPTRIPNETVRADLARALEQCE
jgi:DnaJ homolog subfamily B member 4